MLPLKRITTAVVGLGRAGWDMHLKPMSEHSGFKIIAVADPVAERCEEAVGLTACAAFPGVRELLRETKPDLVVVATPSCNHYDDVTSVLEAGCHCIAEKPLAMNSKEANDLVSLAKKNGVKLFVHHNHMHYPEYHHLRKILDSGVLGEFFHLRAFWAGHYSRRWDWQTLKKNGGGQLNNITAHALSVVLPLLGSPVSSLYADARNVKDAGDAEDHVHLALKTEAGVTADVVVSSAIAIGIPKWMLCGSRGTLVCSGRKTNLRYYDGKDAPVLTVLDQAAPGRQYLSEELPWVERELEVEPAPVKSFYENVFDVLVHNAEQIITPEAAAEVVRVTEMAYRSRSI